MLSKFIRTINYLKLKNKLVFNRTVSISFNSAFEGMNQIHSNTKFSGYLGYGTYIGEHSKIFGKVGRFTSIGSYVRVNNGAHPYIYPYVSTAPCFIAPNPDKVQNGSSFADIVLFNQFRYAADSKYPVIIGNDVWIGDQVFIVDVDCTGSTPCAVDANGTPLALLPEFAEDPDAMFLLWKDHTSLAEADRINEICKRGDFPDYTRYSGGRCSPEWFWSKLLHILRVNPKVRGAIHSFVEHCDWITAELTGCAVKPSRCAAGHKALWHGEWGGLPPEEFFAAVDPLLVPVRRNLYTETYTADTPVGKLSAKWAEKLGLTTETVVAVGAIDCHVGAVGAGIKPGNMV